MKSTVIAATSILDTANDMFTEEALSQMAIMAGGMDIKSGFEQDSPVVGKVNAAVASNGSLTLDCDFNEDVERLYVVPGFELLDYEIEGETRIIKEVDLKYLSTTATPVDFHLTKISRSFTVNYKYKINLDELIKLKEEYLLTLDNEDGNEFYETHRHTADDILCGFIDWLNVKMNNIDIAKEIIKDAADACKNVGLRGDGKDRAGVKLDNVN